MNPNRTYLGDSVYAEIDNGAIKLTGENAGDSKTHTIYLEGKVLLELQRFVLRLNFDGEGFVLRK